MKKLVLISTLIASFAGLSAFGQGYFQFVTGKSQAWTGFNGGAAALSTSVNVAFLWAPSGAVPSVSALGVSVPNSTTVAASTYTTAAAWTAILTDPNFTLAVASANSTIAVQRTAANGGAAFNSNIAFGVTDTSVGTAYTLFIIGWNGAFATPALAQAAAGTTGYVGWSQPFAYTAYAQSAVPTSFGALGGQFGVAGMVPEPSTMALAGLGGLSLLLFRRRK